MPDLVLVVLAQPNYNMQSCVDLRGYFVTPDRLHRSVVADPTVTWTERRLLKKRALGNWNSPGLEQRI